MKSNKDCKNFSPKKESNWDFAGGREDATGKLS